MAKQKEITISNNKKANYAFQLEDTFTAGMLLKGSEIKSIRNSQVTMSDAYCVFMKGELWVKGLHIAEYKEASHNNHETKRDRKLLLNKRELKKLLAKVKVKGYSIVPTRLFISERGMAKLEIALAKGKKLFDKRHDLKRKDLEREIERKVK